MKNVTTGLMVLAVLSMASCKKEEKKEPNTPNPTPTQEKSYWKLDNTTYVSVVGAKQNEASGLYILNGKDSNVLFPDNECNIYFKKYPTQNGTYKVVSEDEDGPNDGEVTLLVMTPDDWFWSDNGGTATITVKDGKVTANIAPIKVYTSGHDDTAEFSCNIIQTK